MSGIKGKIQEWDNCISFSHLKSPVFRLFTFQNPPARFYLLFTVLYLPLPVLGLFPIFSIPVFGLRPLFSGPYSGEHKLQKIKTE
jgi:hypothetical protein